MLASNVLTYNNYRIKLLLELQRERIKQLDGSFNYIAKNYKPTYLEDFQKITQILDKKPLAVQIYFTLGKLKKSPTINSQNHLANFNFFPNYLANEIGSSLTENDLVKKPFWPNWLKNSAIILSILPLLIVLTPILILICFLDNRWIQLIENRFVLSQRAYQQPVL